MTAYFISGLGADKRVFENLKLNENIIIKHIHWIEPLHDETLPQYAKRLSEQIDLTEEFILIGMSLGGMIAVELNKIINPKRTIIISSVVTNKEYSFLFRLINFIKLQKLTPAFLLKIPGPFAYWFFGIKSKSEKKLLKSFMALVSDTFLKWSVNQVLVWKNDFRPPNLFHIHGTADKIFPYRNTNADLLIKNGGHFIIYNRAEEISSILKEIIDLINK